MCVGIACSRNLKKIYIPKFQRSKLSKFITNLPLRHVVTSTYSFFVGIIGTFYEPCVILQICLNIKTWWWFFILLKDYKTTSVLMPFILAGSSGVCLIYHLPTAPVFSYLLLLSSSISFLVFPVIVSLLHQPAELVYTIANRSEQSVPQLPYLFQLSDAEQNKESCQQG